MNPTTATKSTCNPVQKEYSVRCHSRHDQLIRKINSGPSQAPLDNYLLYTVSVWINLSPPPPFFPSRNHSVGFHVCNNQITKDILSLGGPQSPTTTVGPRTNILGYLAKLYKSTKICTELRYQSEG